MKIRRTRERNRYQWIWSRSSSQERRVFPLGIYFCEWFQYEKAARMRV